MGRGMTLPCPTLEPSSSSWPSFRRQANQIQFIKITADLMYDQPSFQNFSAPDSSEGEYKKAIQYMKMQYEETFEKLAESERELGILKARGKGDSFELENQTFEFRSQMNELKYKFMSEKEEMALMHQNQMEALEDQFELKLQEEEDRHKSQMTELTVGMNDRNALMRELETKPIEFIKEIQSLQDRNRDLEEQNRTLKQMVTNLSQENNLISGKQKDNRFTQLAQLNNLRSENDRFQKAAQINRQTILNLEVQVSRLKTELVNAISDSEKLVLINKDKLYFANGEVERYKKLLQTYKTMNGEKEVEIKKLSEELMEMEIQKSKGTQTNNLDQNKTLQKVQAQVKELIDAASFSKSQAAKNQENNANIIAQLTKEVDRLKALVVARTSQLESIRQRERILLQQSKQKNTEIQSKGQQIHKLRSQITLRDTQKKDQSDEKVREYRDLFQKAQEELSEANNRLSAFAREGKKAGREAQTEDRSLKAKMEKLKQENTELELRVSRISQLEYELQSKQDILKDLRRENTLQTQSKKKLQIELNQYMRAARELKAQNQNLKQIIEVGSLQGNSAIQRDQNDNLMRVVSSLKQDISAQKAKTKGKQQLLIQLRTQLSKMADDKDLTQLRVVELSSQQQSLQARIQLERDHWKKESARLSSSVETLRRSLNQSKIQSSALKGSLQDSASHLEVITSQLETAKVKLKQFEAYKRKWVQSQEELKRKLEQLSKEGIEAASQFQQKEENLQTRLRSSQTEKQRQANKLKKLETQLESKRHLEQELETVQEKLADMERASVANMTDFKRRPPLQLSKTPELAKWRVEKEELEKENEELSRKLDQLERSGDTARRELLGFKKQLNAANSSEQAQRERCQELEMELKQTQHQIQQAKKDKATLTSEKRRELLSHEEQLLKYKQTNEDLVRSKQTQEHQIARLKTSLANLVKDQKKHHIVSEQQLEAVKLQKDDLNRKLEELFKAKQAQQVRLRKVNDQLVSLRVQRSEDKQEYGKLYEQYQNQKTKNTKQIRKFQEAIQDMNEKLVGEKREYQVKNANIFKTETNLYNQINNANLELDRLSQEKEQLTGRLYHLEVINAQMKAALMRSTQDNIKLTEEIMRDRFNQAPKNLNNDIQDLRRKENITGKTILKPSKEELMVAQLEFKLREMQEANNRIKRAQDFSPISKNKTNQLLQLKIEHSKLRNDYNRLQQKYQQLALQNTQLTIQQQKYKRRTTKEIYDIRVVDQSELRNVYQQVETLNNILIEKDREIEYLKRLSTQNFAPVTKQGNSHSFSHQYSSQLHISGKVEPVRDMILKAPEGSQYQRMVPVIAIQDAMPSRDNAYHNYKN